MQAGTVSLKDDRVVGGTFTLDMTSIVNLDMESEEWNQKLVGHLKSDDFFSVNTYSTAGLVITNVEKVNSKKHKITADLTIKGITKRIAFEASAEKNKFAAKIQIDRTQFNVRYGSGSFFDGLGDNMIYDEFELTVILEL